MVAVDISFREICRTMGDEGKASHTFFQHQANRHDINIIFMTTAGIHNPGYSASTKIIK